MREMVILFDYGARHKVDNDTLSNQGRGLIIHLKDGTTWYRRISPGSRRNHYHVTAAAVDPIMDAEVEWVAEIIAIQPARSLPDERS